MRDVAVGAGDRGGIDLDPVSSAVFVVIHQFDLHRLAVPGGRTQAIKFGPGVFSPWRIRGVLPMTSSRL